VRPDRPRLYPEAVEVTRRVLLRVLVNPHDEDAPLEPHTGRSGAVVVEAIVEMTELGEKAGRTWLEH
jgi:hypothetical protein